MASLIITKLLFPTTFNDVRQNNLRTPDPKETYAGNSDGYIFFDMGAPVTVDTFFMGFNSAAVTAWNVYTTPTLGGARTAVGGTAVIGPTDAYRRHAMLKLPAPVTSQFWSYRMGTGVGGFVGIFAMGLSIQPQFGREWGSGRLPIDLSAKTELRGGGFGIERGARKGLFQWTMGDLSDAETAALWNMARDIGESAPVLVHEDPDFDNAADWNERLHYGLFERPEAYERLLPGLNRWSFRLREWV